MAKKTKNTIKKKDQRTAVQSQASKKKAQKETKQRSSAKIDSHKKKTKALSSQNASRKKVIIIYYSRTDTTRKVASRIAKRIGCDHEEIIDKKKRSGVLGYIISIKDAIKKSSTPIRPIQKDISRYKLVIIGTPVWAMTMSAPIRSFIRRHGNQCNKIALFVTMGGSGHEKTIGDMQDLIGKKAIKTASFRTKEVVQESDAYKKDLETFIKGL